MSATAHFSQARTKPRAAMHKKSIMKRTVEVGSATLLSRMCGLVREVLLVRFLGAGVLSDAFLMAYKLPNSLRKVFAEGALTAAFVPTFVAISRKESKDEANALMALAFLVFEGALLLLCAGAIAYSTAIIHFLAPGFDAEQARLAAHFFEILMPFIFFISSSALLAGALQSVNHFFVPAFSPVLLNIVWIATLVPSLLWAWSVDWLCYSVLVGGGLQLFAHVLMYVRRGFGFARITGATWQVFGGILVKFFVCFLSMSALEINFIIDARFGSCLSAGSVSLLNYASRFMGIPLGVFGVAFSTILLPHFSRITLYAPRRLSFYLHEATKLIFWVTVPATIIICFFAQEIFLTIFFNPKKFTMLQVFESRDILIAFTAGLFFFALNKILLNIYYSKHNMVIPTLVSLVATAANLGLNMLLTDWLKAPGIALATTLSFTLQAMLCMYILHVRFGFKLYLGRLALFMARYTVQLAAVLVPFFASFYVIRAFLRTCAPWCAYFFLQSYGFWLWTSPLVLGVIVALFTWRRAFKVRLYFLD